MSIPRPSIWQRHRTCSIKPIGALKHSRPRQLQRNSHHDTPPRSTRTLLLHRSLTRSERLASGFDSRLPRHDASVSAISGRAKTSIYCDAVTSRSSKVHLHGKGDKWQICPLWEETVKQLERLLADHQPAADELVFCARRRRSLTRFGIYKIIRRHAASWDTTGPQPRRVSPHLFRHTAATHLLESGIEVNVIRGWLGHVSLDTTNRYTELTLRAKAEALRACEVPCGTTVGTRSRPAWKDDKTLLDWLNSL